MHMHIYVTTLSYWADIFKGISKVLKKNRMHNYDITLNPTKIEGLTFSFSDV